MNTRIIANAYANESINANENNCKFYQFMV